MYMHGHRKLLSTFVLDTWSCVLGTWNILVDNINIAVFVELVRKDRQIKKMVIIINKCK